MKLRIEVELQHEIENGLKPVAEAVRQIELASLRVYPQIGD